MQTVILQTITSLYCHLVAKTDKSRIPNLVKYMNYKLNHIKTTYQMC